MARSGNRVDVSGFRELGAKLGLGADHVDEAIFNAIKGEGGEAILSAMRLGMYNHVKTGRTLAELQLDAGMGDKRVEIGVKGARAFVARYLESGTRPHTITAPPGESLFFSGSHISEVSHPGAKRYRIAGKALTQTKWEMDAAIRDEMDRLADRMGFRRGEG